MEYSLSERLEPLSSVLGDGDVLVQDHPGLHVLGDLRDAGVDLPDLGLEHVHLLVDQACERKVSISDIRTTETEAVIL
ncbi:hypothetical protein CEXT_727041 [Caerostris extrusa]|uniref:Uncharacterized protein n=1 Tax=Caerostris extrusa TaxID=172846 RepID=A0AAV4NAI0_CAEEX|nr:hypothetical protein CEXT_727041 [Caerostris extrusa]